MLYIMIHIIGCSYCEYINMFLVLSSQGEAGNATVPQSWGAEFIKSALQEEPC